MSESEVYSVRDQLADLDEFILLSEDMDDALLGYVEIAGNLIALYDRMTCIRIFMFRDGMTYEDALEHFQYNVAGAYVGEKTPAFATFLQAEE